MTLYLSRLTLDRAAGNAALMPLLDPASPAQARAPPTPSGWPDGCGFAGIILAH